MPRTRPLSAAESPESIDHDHHAKSGYDGHPRRRRRTRRWAEFFRIRTLVRGQKEVTGHRSWWKACRAVTPSVPSLRNVPHDWVQSRPLTCTLHEVRALTYPFTLPASRLQRDHEQNHRRVAPDECNRQNLVPSSFSHGVGSNGTETELHPVSSRAQPPQHDSGIPPGVGEGIGPCLGAMLILKFRCRIIRTVGPFNP